LLRSEGERSLRFRRSETRCRTYTYDALTCMYDYPPQLASSTHKFTGKERDSESNLDNFGARSEQVGQSHFVNYWITT